MPTNTSSTKTKQKSTTVKPSRTATKTVDLVSGSTAGIPDRVIETPLPAPIAVENTVPPVQQTQTLVVDPTRRLQSTDSDLIWHAEAIVDFVEPIKAHLKGKMLESKAKFADGQFSFARIDTTGPTRTVDALKFLRMCRAANLKDSQIAQMISVSAKEMQQHFSISQIADATIEGPPKSPSMKIDTIKGADAPDIMASVDAITMAFPRIQRDRIIEKDKASK
jgi:hypothetical protein